jgi:4-diphosphocytidyl-2-C-methyl-D-erythritol kinase
MSLSCYSPCKINLYLNVLSPRPDGFHEIVTVMEPAGLMDRLVFREIPAGIEVTCDHPGVLGGKDNIVYKAAEMLHETTRPGSGIAIRIEKRVPIAAGLGGGSANAAAALKVLNALWGIGLDDRALRGLAERLGSDVPFFLDPRTSLCRGRGEIITPLPPAPPFWMVLINPGVAVSTRRAYADLDKAKRRPAPPVEPLLRALEKGDLKEIAPCLYNAFEEVVAAATPEVRRSLEFLRGEGALAALMSGSGSTAVGVMEDRSAADTVAARAGERLPRGWTIAAVPNLRGTGPARRKEVH